DRLALATLISSLVLTLLTLAAEIGGVGLVLTLLFDGPEQTFMLAGAIALGLVCWFLPFDGIERIFGYGGLLLLVFVVTALHFEPNWSSVAKGFVPEAHDQTLYWYFALGLVAAAFMPYEIYFYSSGAREEGWTEKDLGVNRANAIIGYLLGGLLAVGLLVMAAQIFQPAGISPDHLATVALGPQTAFGETGLILALIGMLFAFGGAAIDTCFSAAYNLAQFNGWPWGKKAKNPVRWNIAWIGFLAAGYVIVSTGVDPIQLTEYAVVLSVIALPLTYLPILLVAGNKQVMGEHANGWLAKGLGWLYFALICVMTVAAPILLFATNGGGG
ncbi:MAG TPA: divalent metal cation transporter, partial [Baekduia sp.]|nr:divalent metal cation transporter [Baekduia sp.]